jgi:hypothetical protein
MSAITLELRKFVAPELVFGVDAHKQGVTGHRKSARHWL